MKSTLLFLLVPCCLVAGLPSLQLQTDPSSRNSIEEAADYNDCLTKGSVSCVKYKIFTLVDKVLGSRESFTLTEGVTLVKNPGTVTGDGAPRSLSAEEIQKEDVESLVFSRVERFLSTHTLKLDLKGSEVVDAVSSAGRALGDVAENMLGGEEEEGTGQESARKKIKKAGKTLLPLLLLLKLKAAALIPLALGAIALLAGKALLIGKIALLLSIIIGLQKLLAAKQQKTVTYEIVSHPHHSASHEHHEHGWSSGGGGDVSGGGWGRSSDLAYRGYQPQAKQ